MNMYDKLPRVIFHSYFRGKLPHNMCAEIVYNKNGSYVPWENPIHSRTNYIKTKTKFYILTIYIYVYIEHLNPYNKNNYIENII